MRGGLLLATELNACRTQDRIGKAVHLILDGIFGKIALIFSLISAFFGW